MKILLAGKFRVDKKVQKGNFSEIFCGTDIYSRRKVAVKVQSVQSQVPLVDYESRVYKCLGGGVGIPKMHWHGVDGPYNMLVMDLLGPTITDLLKCFEEFGLELMLLLAQQILDRLEYVHSKDFLYRDVKPQNFMFKRGLKGKHGDLNLYVIDFSLAKRFTYPKTKQHIPMRRKTGFQGVSPFASYRARQGFEQSRRDDLEALGNMMMYLQYGELPMNFMRTHFAEDGMRAADSWLSTVPAEFVPYLKYTQNLRFEEQPDYEMARRLLHEAIMEAHDYKFIIDWTICELEQDQDEVLDER